MSEHNITDAHRRMILKVIEQSVNRSLDVIEDNKEETLVVDQLEYNLKHQMSYWREVVSWLLGEFENDADAESAEGEWLETFSRYEDVVLK